MGFLTSLNWLMSPRDSPPQCWHDSTCHHAQLFIWVLGMESLRALVTSTWLGFWFGFRILFESCSCYITMAGLALAM